MCLAIPGKVVELNGAEALVDFGGNRVRVAAVFTPEARCGDWVLVHAGFTISTIDEAEALTTWEYLRDFDAEVRL
ncbi:MAG: HypC/HybG/HupF family hydrogenase formation chaperone [Phycisphaerales bacterium]|nr:HypC/HybG/HupF family hydrogenase formation chaperone [Phycisphaerales bacterium]